MDLLINEFVDCPACKAGQNSAEALLGALGNLVHFRCRYCGADWSQESEKEDDMDTSINVIIQHAVRRAREQQARGASCVPIFADVFLKGEKIGHIVSDGYANERWNWHPKQPDDGTHRNAKRDCESAEAAVPKYAKGFTFGPFRTSTEITQEHQRKAEERRQAERDHRRPRSDEEDRAREEMLGKFEAELDHLVDTAIDRAALIGGHFRGPGIQGEIWELLRAKARKLPGGKS